MRTFFIVLLVVFSSPGAHADEPKALFLDDSVLMVEIKAPLKTIIKEAEKVINPYDGTLSLSEPQVETHEITLSARGNSRREKKLCKFPPLRVRFHQKPGDDQLFNGQKGLKLVTHCERSSRFQQYYLREYLAYKLYNLMTPASLNVRLAQITYIDSDTDDEMTTRFGFFIEDTDDAARRLGMKEIDVDDIDIEQVDKVAAARFALFQYMIANLDWSMHDGTDEHCCHNAKLIGEREQPYKNLIPVPYDFDYSGLVDAPYAIPPDSVNVRSVRTRRYRGFCAHNEEFFAQLPVFREAQDDIIETIESVPGLNNDSKNSAKRFIESFYRTISTEEEAMSVLLKHCRGSD